MNIIFYLSIINIYLFKNKNNVKISYLVLLSQKKHEKSIDIVAIEYEQTQVIFFNFF